MSSNKLKCLIIDDDRTITDLVSYYCSKIDFIEYCITCNNPIDGLKLISSESFDLIFLDYNMPDLDGKSILDIKTDKSKVIMITSNSSFAVDSYAYPQVIDYLLKPIVFDRFFQSVSKFQDRRTQSQENSITGHHFVKDGNKWVKVNLDEVYFIKSESNYVTWQLKERQILSLMKMKELEEELPPHFKRIHRSYIINTAHLDFFTTEEVRVMGKMIPIGAKYKDVIKEILNQS